MMSPGRKWGQSIVVAANSARCLPFSPSASLGMSPSLWRCQGSGCALGLPWPRSKCVQWGCGCLETLLGKGGFVCSWPSHLAEESLCWLPAGCGGRTRSGKCSMGWEQSGVTTCCSSGQIHLPKPLSLGHLHTPAPHSPCKGHL